MKIVLELDPDEMSDEVISIITAAAAEAKDKRRLRLERLIAGCAAYGEVMPDDVECLREILDCYNGMAPSVAKA